ncbi:MAG: SGNH/GDSL hydrolase family protein [Candidatus Eremiobacteraeota bacterium]|nr:SGNH/GDSL hydrolase family protein [Candidatus Eremiobacteraeota bacterium]
MFAALILAALTLAPDVRMTVVGDSLALGVGASDSSRGFAFDVFRRVRAERPKSEVTNLAIGGATAADVVRLEVPRIAATRPSVVLVEAGANDAVRRHSAAEFARSYRALVAGIERAAPHAVIVLFNVPDVSVCPIFEGAAKAPLRRLALAYNLGIANEGRHVRAPIVDLFAFSARAAKDTARYFSADLFHPSDEGHTAIANAAWSTLRPLLLGRSPRSSQLRPFDR